MARTRVPTIRVPEDTEIKDHSKKSFISAKKKKIFQTNSLNLVLY